MTQNLAAKANRANSGSLRYKDPLPLQLINRSLAPPFLAVPWAGGGGERVAASGPILNLKWVAPANYAFALPPASVPPPAVMAYYWVFLLGTGHTGRGRKEHGRAGREREGLRSKHSSFLLPLRPCSFLPLPTEPPLIQFSDPLAKSSYVILFTYWGEGEKNSENSLHRDTLEFPLRLYYLYCKI